MFLAQDDMLCSIFLSHSSFVLRCPLEFLMCSFIYNLGVFSWAMLGYPSASKVDSIKFLDVHCDPSLFVTSQSWLLSSAMCMPQAKLLNSRLCLSATMLTYAKVSADMSVDMFVYVSTDGPASPWVVTQSTIDVGALINELLQSQHCLRNTRVPEHVHGIACSRLGSWDCVATDDDTVDRRIGSLEGIPEANNSRKMRRVGWREPH